LLHLLLLLPAVGCAFGVFFAAEGFWASRCQW